MNCEQIRAQLGTYADGALDSAVLALVETHIQGCAPCQAELRSLRLLADRIGQTEEVLVPDGLWAAIEQRLPRHSPTAHRRWTAWRRPRLVAVAAAIVLLIGTGSLLFDWPGNGGAIAEAAPINFGVMLDALRLDAEAAFKSFLDLYEAKVITAGQAKLHAPQLTFTLPDHLEGGFRLRQVYGLRFGRQPGVAARYDRHGEMLVAIFHPAIHNEDFGTHRDYACVIGEHRGHTVSVGEWKLVHVTDPTTCHCVLSRLDEQLELPPILRALVPGEPNKSADHHPGGHRP